MPGFDGWANGPLLLYHGTGLRDAKRVESGVELSRGRESADFGQGFYTTTWWEQACNWADKRTAITADQPAVVWFEVDRTALGNLETLAFVRSKSDAEDLWQFIWHCRLQIGPHRPSEGSSMYDVVCGPVAAKRWDRRRAITHYDQVSWHTTRAVRLLDSSPKGVAPWEPAKNASRT